jgi:hypothetical protein
MYIYIVLIAVLGSVLWMDVAKPESFEPQPETLAVSIMEGFQRRGINIAPGGLRGVTATTPVVSDPVQEPVWNIVLGRRPAFQTTSSFRLLFTTTGGDAIRTQTLRVRGRGETREASRRDSELGVRRVIETVISMARMRGYMT